MLEKGLQTFALEANPHKYSYVIESAKEGGEGREREKKKTVQGGCFPPRKKGKRIYTQKWIELDGADFP